MEKDSNIYFMNEFQVSGEKISWCDWPRGFHIGVVGNRVNKYMYMYTGRNFFILFITKIDNVRCLWISDNTIKETYLVDCVN